MGWKIKLPSVRIPKTGPLPTGNFPFNMKKFGSNGTDWMYGLSALSAAGVGGAAMAGGSGGAGGGAEAAAAGGGSGMGSFWGPLAAGIFGGGFNYFQQQQANKQNREISREQMAFQERMSSTAHQREVADLQAAGLNPILSAGGNGSSTPTGAGATMQAPQIDMPGIWSMAMSERELKLKEGALANETARTTADLIKKQTDTISSQEKVKLQRLQQILMQKGMSIQEFKAFVPDVIKAMRNSEFNKKNSIKIKQYEEKTLP